MHQHIRGRYESPASEILELIQEEIILNPSDPYSSEYNANPNWGGANGSSGSNLGGEGSSNIYL